MNFMCVLVILLIITQNNGWTDRQQILRVHRSDASVHDAYITST